jgi:hypothetical protein
MHEAERELGAHELGAAESKVLHPLHNASSDHETGNAASLGPEGILPSIHEVGYTHTSEGILPSIHEVGCTHTHTHKHTPHTHTNTHTYRNAFCLRCMTWFRTVLELNLCMYGCISPTTCR